MCQLEHRIYVKDSSTQSELSWHLLEGGSCFSVRDVCVAFENEHDDWKRVVKKTSHIFVQKGLFTVTQLVDTVHSFCDVLD